MRKDWTISMSEFRNFAEKYQWKIDELEEENRKLKKECEENDYLVEDNARWIKRCVEKTMEIKKLKLENADLMWERDGLKMVVERLHKEIEEIEKPRPRFSDFWWYDE